MAVLCVEDLVKPGWLIWRYHEQNKS